MTNNELPSIDASPDGIIVRLHAVVRGRVQGVGFRQWAVKESTRLGVTGWVRNLDSGDVELCAEGSDPLIDQLTQRLHEGPVTARVKSVEISKTQCEAGEFEGFSLRR